MTQPVTKESLIARIADLEYGARSLKEDYTLAAYKMLLATMAAEPVAVVRYVDAGFKRPGIHVSVYDTSLPDGTELFTSPQPAPVLVMRGGSLRQDGRFWYSEDVIAKIAAEAGVAVKR